LSLLASLPAPAPPREAAAILQVCIETVRCGGLIYCLQGDDIYVSEEYHSVVKGPAKSRSVVLSVMCCL
jgi:hypothetical protein